MSRLDNYIDYYGPVRTTSGQIRGCSDDGVYIFKNIKYAQARRFHSPEEVSWDGIRDCTYYGYQPPLVDKPGIKDHLFVPHFYWVEDEKECLNLNVWTPSMDRKSKLPVIMTVYGGSFDSGCSYEMQAYEGTNLSRNGNVVYVSVNMRANMLGFFSLSCFGSEYANTGNLGFEDILAALKWVKANAETFGGDPDNITLLGMQGGALRIRYIMQCPAFKGLFSKAFLLSGICDHGRPSRAERFHHMAKAMLATGGYDENDVTPLVEMDLDDLRKLYHKTVELHPEVKVRWRVDLNGWCYGRTEDEGVCPEMKDITVICGNTFTEQYFTPDKYPEGRLSMGEFEQQARERFADDYDEVISLFRKIYPDKDIRDVLFYAIDHRKAIYDYCSVLADAGMKAYVYQFLPELPFNHDTPSFHCSDVPYIMQNVEMVPALIIPGVSAELSAAYSSALINLAHHGDPAHGILREWKPFEKGTNKCMLFDKNVHMMSEDDSRLVELLSSHMPTRKK